MQSKTFRQFSRQWGGFLLMSLSLMIGCATRDHDWLTGAAAQKEWRVYLGDQASSHYSALKQINQENVVQLQAAWIYQTGDLPESDYGEMQCTPIIVSGVLYGSTPRTKIFALDAGTGKEIWTFDSFAERPEEAYTQGRHRGVTYWQDETGKILKIRHG